MAPFRFSVITKVLHAHTYICVCLLFTLLVTAGISTASAGTAEDVMKKMSADQRWGYVSGLVDMLAYQTAATGNQEKGNCIADKFYGESRDMSVKRLFDVMAQYPDKRPEILMKVVADQLCKK